MSDEELFALYLTGNKNAFNELISRYMSNVTNYINSIVKNKYLADDIFQDCVMYILQHPETYNPIYKFQSYIFLIARKRTLSKIEREKRRGKIVEENFENPDKLIYRSDLSDLMLQKENESELMKALDTLKPEYREAIYYIDILKMQHKEVESLLKKDNTRVLVFRARKKLREVIEKEYPDLAKMYTPPASPGKKIVQVFIACSLATSVTAGMVFATIRFYESVWKKPQYFSLTDSNHESQGYFGIIDVSEAREKIDHYLKILGETDYNLMDVEFHNDIAYQNELFRLVSVGDFDIRISARTGELRAYYTNESGTSKNVMSIDENFRKEDLIEQCNELYEKLDFSEEYQLYKCEKIDYATTDDGYEVMYCTQYDGVFNVYDSITFALEYSTGEVRNIVTTNYQFEDSEIVITKPEAEEIFYSIHPDEKIENIEIDIREQSNDAVYVDTLESGEMIELDENQTYTKLIQNARRVWKIQYIEDSYNAVYFYIDCTTGEVVGEDISYRKITEN